MTARTGRIPAIDGLRGIAILLVIYQHSIATAVGKASAATFGLSFPYITGNAWMGVSLFFILSGFVLAIPYLQGERQMHSRGDALTFYKHRALRLLPLFVFMSVVSYAFGMAVGQHNYRSLFLAITTGSMLTRSEFFPTINGPFWSLAIEIWFSIAFPFVLWIIARVGFWRSVAYILAVSLAVRAAGSHFEFLAIHQNPLKDSFVARTDDFLIGMAIAKLYVDGLRIRRPWLWVMGGIVFLLLAAVGWDLRLQGRIPLLLTALLNNFTQLGFGAILLAAIQEKSTISRWLSVWWLRILGAMCFSIYCWHGLLIRPAMLVDPFNPWLLLEFWSVLLVLAAFTYRFIEFPKAKSIKALFLLETR